MEKDYSQLDLEERIGLSRWRDAGCSKREIGRKADLKRVAVDLIRSHALSFCFRKLFFAKPVTTFAQHALDGLARFQPE